MIPIELLPRHMHPNARSCQRRKGSSLMGKKTFNRPLKTSQRTPGAYAALSFSKTIARKSSEKSLFAMKRNSVSSCIKFLEFQESSKVYWILFIRMIYVTVWSHQRVRSKIGRGRCWRHQMRRIVLSSGPIWKNVQKWWQATWWRKFERRREWRLGMMEDNYVVTLTIQSPWTTSWNLQ